jgi:phosphoenolpyruvate-protein kinase (PTS system EI component)
MIEDHKIFERIQNLLDDPTLHSTLAESINTDLYQISIAAGKKCQKFREPEWLVQLHKARTRVGILKRVLSICGTRYDQYSQIEEL